MGNLIDELRQVKMFTNAYISVTDINEPVRTAAITEELLSKTGWCMWSCHNLNDDKIVIVIDESIIPQLPAYAEFPVYTLNELKLLITMNDIRLVHEAKKYGAVIKSVKRVDANEKVDRVP